MRERDPTPAETYKLNTLASVLGRYAVPDPSPRTLSQNNEMLDGVIDSIRLYDVPEVPRVNSALLEEATKFDEKLLTQVNQGPAIQFISATRQKALNEILTKHAEYCAENTSNSSEEMVISRQTIADAYGIADLFDDSEFIIRNEVDTWGIDTKHPEIPEYLQQKVELEETRQLLGVMWRRIVETKSLPEVNTYLTDDTSNYHVYWSPVAETLDYATPRSYDRATQLSFDLPHNATHLAHLDAIGLDKGSATYDDSMQIRAYFEAVTVLSEYQTVKVATEDEDFGTEIATIMKLSGSTAPEDVAVWIAEDRSYEFKLRAARYAADVMMTGGAEYREIVDTISKTFGITELDAAKETRKYLPWTGLGAAYTFGYRKLQSLGVNKVSDAFVDTHGKAITSWYQKLQSKLAENKK